MGTVCTTRWMVIRRTEGREWIDTATASPDWIGAEEIAKRQDELLPAWARANPVRRTVRVTIAEVS